MAGAARSGGRKASCLGLLTLPVLGCASAQPPPGGPPDFTPPVLESVSPDSGAVIEGFEDRVAFQFDEVVSERTPGLENLFQISPRPEEIDASWKRSRLEVRPAEGWTPGVTYTVTLLPGVTDLRNNRWEDSRTILFSTGGEIPDTRIEGTVVDWETHRIAVGAVVEALLFPDSLAYIGVADSSGHFVIPSAPKGRYRLTAFLDQNSDRRLSFREVFDSVSVMLDSTVSRTLWTFSHDTVGPRISTLSRIDSLAIEVTFNQKVDTIAPAPEDVTVQLLPDSQSVEVARIWFRSQFDSVRAEARARADSARADSVTQADSAAAPPTPVDTVTPEPPAGPGATPGQPGAGPDSLAVPGDSAREPEVLSERPRLTDTWVVELRFPMSPGARYLVTVTAANVFGGRNESRAVIVMPEPAAPDSL